MTAPLSPPLAGITVVALEHAVAAPLASRHLADLGARIIKVERPGVGDFARGYDASVHGQASYFVWLNRGKESLELNLKDPDDKALLDRVIAQADVVLENLAPGAAGRLGLDAATLRAAHPRLIHCAISGYGAEGPYSHKKAYDLLVQCESGLVSVTGTEQEPVKVGTSVVDIATGMYAYSGILAALFDRERTGVGSTLQVSMLDAIGEWMMQPTYYSVYGGNPVPRTGARHASIAPYGPFACRDGTVFMGVQNDREWTVLATTVLNRPELVDDSRFATNVARTQHQYQLTEVIEAAWMTRSVDEVLATLEEQQIACAQLRDPHQFFTHPQLAARDRWRDVDTPAGPVRALLPPVVVAGREAVMGPVPRVGSHNAAIRAEFGPDASAT